MPSPSTASSRPARRSWWCASTAATWSCARSGRRDPRKPRFRSLCGLAAGDVVGVTWAAVVIVLFVAGCILAAAELIALPGFGVMAALSAAAFVAAAVVAGVELGLVYGVLALI